MNIRLIAVTLIATALPIGLNGCADVHVPGVYRIDVQQGNVITQEMLAHLRPGMDKRQVRFLLGTPLVIDTFNQERWDYYYSLEKGRFSKRFERRLVVLFDNNRLSRWETSKSENAEPIPKGESKEIVVAVPDRPASDGILRAFFPFKSKAKKKKTPDPVAENTTDAETAPPESQANPQASSTEASTNGSAPASESEEGFFKRIFKDYGGGATPTE